MNRIRHIDNRKLRFPGDLADLKAWVRSAHLKGVWEETPIYWRFRCRTGAILNWWPSTGTINFQGPAREKYALIKGLASAFCGPFIEGKEALGEKPSHTTKAITFQPDEGEL